ESLYAISKRYVCAEECIRRANDFPLTGNVTLQIGQTLIIPDCTCQMPGYVAPRTPATTGPPPQVSNILNPQTTPQQPYQPDVPVEYNYQNPAATRNAAANNAATI